MRHGRLKCNHISANHVIIRSPSVCPTLSKLSSSSPSDCVYIADWEPSGVVGWEANSTGKLAPCHVDLGPSMDPHRLAESAVTLNVSLMRWRAAPSLGIDRLQDLKILLLGAGEAVALAVMSCAVLSAADGSDEQDMWCRRTLCCI